jgi:hypothetical protein
MALGGLATAYLGNHFSGVPAGARLISHHPDPDDAGKKFAKAQVSIRLAGMVTKAQTPVP